MKFWRVLLILAIASLPTLLFAEEYNAGIVSGIWYSETPVFAGETVTVYAALQNQSGADLSGTAEFMAGDEVFATKDVSAGSGQLLQVSADWTPEFGQQTVVVRISEATFAQDGQDPVTVSDFGSAVAPEQFVDRDTDGDRVGDQEDSDDDNDGLPDVDEERIGSDPLLTDTDGDGVPDGEDGAPTDPEKTETQLEAVIAEVQSTVDVVDSDEGFEKFVDVPIVDKTLGAATSASDSVEEKLRDVQDDIESAEADVPKDQKTWRAKYLAPVVGFFSKVFGNPFIFQIVMILVLFLVLKLLFKLFTRQVR